MKITSMPSIWDSDKNARYSVLLWHRLARIHKNNTTGSNQILKNWDLSNAQMDLISRIAEAGQLSQQELADKLLVTKGNITQLLKKLETMELIKKERDWKIKYISLTEKGQSLYDEVRPELEEYQKAYFQKLSLDEKRQLLTLLRKLEG